MAALLVLFFVLIGASYGQGNDIISCGGFIKAKESSVDLTKIKVQLITASGAIKHVSEPLPNGYYMIPIYERLDYLVRVAPVKGFSFEPANPVKVDFKVCEENGDYNFEFVGFALEGKVVSGGSDAGPNGVKISLNIDGKETQSTNTAENGRFSFKKVLPGKYEIKASGDYHFTKEKITLELKDKPVELKENLIIHGYSVNGKVLHEGRPVKNVKISLNSNSAVEAIGCTKDNNGCYLQTNEEGRYYFKSIPAGDYTVNALYADKKTQFDIEPFSIGVSVKHGAVNVKDDFIVTGFSVHGVVLSYKGVAVPNAQVFLDGKHVAQTGSDGSYTVSSLRSGDYTLSASADGVQFDELEVKITSTDPRFPDLIAVRTLVSGIISHADNNQISGVTISFYNDNYRETARSSNDGRFSVYLPAGEFTVKTSMNDLSPVSQKINVQGTPITSDRLRFSQFKTDLTGSIVCKETCSAVDVELYRSGQRIRIVKVDEKSKKSVFTFPEVPAGDYLVKVTSDGWCWEYDEQEVMLSEGKLSNIEFNQQGFVITVNTPQEMKTDYGLKGANTTLKESLLRSGSNDICVERSGEYEIKPQYCHQLEKTAYTVKSGGRLDLEISKLKVKFVLITPVEVKDVKLEISGDDNYKQVLSISTLKKDLPKHTIESELFVPINSGALSVTPISETVLFPQQSLTIRPRQGCPPSELEVLAEEGLFITGSTSPPTSGLQIVLIDEDKTTSIFTQTDHEGKYRFGPLVKKKYTVSSSKEGYIISKITDSEFNFNVYRLAQVNVKVICDSETLPGVLLSLSGSNSEGGSFRSNHLTNDAGQFTFIGLAPGGYYLQAILKEYQFQPSSQQVQVNEGENTEVVITGTRIAFSFLGAVVDLAGRPVDAPVTIKATGTEGDCYKKEETVKPDKTGQFRLRGMEPACTYDIEVINEPSEKKVYYSVTPTKTTVKMGDGDMMLAEFVAVKMEAMSEMILFIDTPVEYLKTLTIKMEKDDGSIIYSKPALTKVTYMPSQPINKQKYRVFIESSLDRTVYQYKTEDKHVIIESPLSQVNLSFKPQVTTVENIESRESSIAALTFIFVIVTSIIFKDKIMERVYSERH